MLSNKSLENRAKINKEQQILVMMVDDFMSDLVILTLKTIICQRFLVFLHFKKDTPPQNTKVNRKHR